MAKEKPPKFEVKQGILYFDINDKSYEIDLSQLIYIESETKFACFYQKKEEIIKVRASMKELREAIGGIYLQTDHRKIINMDLAICYDKNHFVISFKGKKMEIKIGVVYNEDVLNCLKEKAIQKRVMKGTVIKKCPFCFWDCEYICKKNDGGKEIEIKCPFDDLNL